MGYCTERHAKNKPFIVMEFVADLCQFKNVIFMQVACECLLLAQGE